MPGTDERVRSGEKVVGVLNSGTRRARTIGEKGPKTVGHKLALVAVFPIALAIVIVKIIIRRFA